MSGVIVEVDARTGRSEEKLEAINRSLRNIEGSSKDTSVAISGMVRSLVAMTTSAVSVAALTKISDEFTTIGNRIAQVTGRTKELISVQSKLSAVSRDTFSSLASTADVFSSIGRSMKQAGSNTTQLVKATASVQKAVALSGANMQTASGALLQLSQGLSSGTLRGEELNSVLEGTPRLAQAIADSLGVTTGKLRLIASEGKLTSDKVFSALLSQSAALEKEFSNFKPTLAQAGSQFSDSFKRAVNEFDKGLGISNAIAASLARNGRVVSKMADDAYAFGNNLRVGIQKAIGNSKLLFGPMAEAVSALGSQLKQAFGGLYIGRTLRGEFNGALASLDALTGGFLTSVKRFKFANLFDIRTPVEDAIRQIKRLNPANWVGFGLNRATFDRIFNLEYLHSIGAAFLNLRDAITSNSDSIFIDLEIFGDKVAFFAKKTIKYFSLTQKSFALLKPSNSEAFFTSMEGIVRGLSGVSIKVWDSLKYLKRLMAPAFDSFLMAMSDSAGAFAKGIAAGIFALGKTIFEFIQEVVTALSDIGSNFSVRGIFGSVLDSFAALEARLTNASMLEQLKDNFKRAVGAIAEFFDELDSSVIHGFWKKSVSFAINIAEDLADAMLKLAVNAVDAVMSIGSEAGAGFLAKSMKNSMMAEFYALFDMSGRATQLFAQTFNAVAAIAVAGLRLAIHYVKEFADRAIYEFFRIYDEVIGHSWWTDTVETVVDTSNTLWDRAAGGLQRFRKNVSGLFESIFKQKRSLNIEDISASFSASQFKLPEIDANSVALSLENFAKKTTEVFKQLFAKFPDMMKLALTAVGAILVTLLFPAGKLKTVLVSTMVSSILSQSTLLGEALGMSVTGHSFMASVAAGAGAFAGFITASIVKEIPQIIDALLTVVSSFTKAFAEQLPVVGGMISTLFGSLSGISGNGPLGLIGVVLFGKGIIGILKELDIGTKAMKTFSCNFANFSKYISGQGDGFISKYLFGIPGPQRVIASMLLLLDAMGTFDSFFAGSELLHMAGQAGLMYTIWFGKAGFEKVKDTAGDAIHYVTDILTKGLKQITAGTKLGDVIFNTSGEKSTKIDAFIKETFAHINKKIIETASPYFERGMEILKVLLLGKNPELTKAGIVAYFNDVKDTMVSAIQKMREPIARAYDKISEKIAAFNHGRMKNKQAAKKQFDAKDFVSDIPDAIDRLRRRFGKDKRKPEDVGSSFDFSGLKEKIVDIAGRFGFKPKVDTGKFTEDVKSMKSTVASSVSESGLLGMLFFGKYSKFAWVAILATVISTAASAATTEIGKSSTPFEDLISNWQDFKLDNPFAAILVEVTAVTLPLLLAALIVFRRQAAGLLAGVVSAESIAKIGSSVGSLVSSIRRHIPAIKAGLAGGVGAALGYAIGNWAGGPEMAQIGILMGATMLAGLGGYILSAIGSVMSAIGALILGAIGWIGVAIVALLTVGAGLLYVAFFGESGEFFKDLSNAKDQLLEMLHLKSKVDGQTGLSEENASYLRGLAGVKIGYDLKDVNTSNLQSGDEDGLKKSIDELNKHIESLKDEERRYGKVSGDSVKTTNSMLEGLTVYVDKLSAKSAFDSDKFGETLRNMRQGDPKNLAQRISMAEKQSINDFLYTANTKFLEMARWVASDRKKAKWTERLEQLKAEKDTKYNARYRPIGTLEELLLNFEGGTKGFQDSSPAQVALSKLIKKQENQYERTLQEIRKKEGGSLFDPVADPNFQLDVNNPLNMKLQKIGGELLANYFKKLHFEKHAGDIRVFNGELDNMVANFKDAGISFNSDALFAKDNAAFDYITSLSKEAKDLAEQLKVTRDTAERNKIIIRIEEVRTKLQKEQNNAELADNSQKQYKLKDKLGKIGISTFSEDIYKFIDDKLADEVFARSNALENRMLDTKTKMVKAMQAPGVGNDKQLAAQIKKPFLQEMAAIRAESKDLQTYIETTVQESMAAGNAFSEIAKNVGGDFNAMVKANGVEKAIKGVNQLNSMSRDAKSALDDNDIDRWQRLNTEMETLRDRLQTLPMNFSEFTGQMGSIGTTVNLEDMLSLSGGTVHALEGAAKAMREIEFTLQHERGDMSPGRLRAFAQQKLELISIAKEAAIQLSYSTGEKISQMLNSSGFSDAFEQSGLSNKMLKDFKIMNNEVQRVKDALADPRNVKQFDVLQHNLYKAQQFVKKMRDDLRGFDGRFEITNSTFNTGLSKQEFAGLPANTAFNLSKDAQVIADKLADAGKKFIEQGSLEAFTEYGNLLAEQRVKSFSAAVTAQKDGTKYRSDAANIRYAGTSEIIDGLISVVPELGDMRVNLESLNRQALETLSVQSLGLASRKRNIDLGIGNETLDDLNRSKDAFADSAAMASRVAGHVPLRVKRAGGNLDNDSFSRLNTKSLGNIDKLASEIRSKQNALKSASLSVEARNRLQDSIDQMFIQMEDAIKRASVNRQRVAYEAGQSFATTIVEGFSSAFTGLIQQKAEEGKTTWTTFRDAVFTMISENVIKTFVDGLSNAVMGEGSPIRNALANIGSNIFSQFQGVGSTEGTDATDTSTAGEGGVLDSIAAFFAPVIGGLTSIFGATSAGATSTTTAISSGTFSIVSAINSGTFSIVSALTAGATTNGIGTALQVLGVAASAAGSFSKPTTPTSVPGMNGGTGLDPTRSGVGLRLPRNATGGFIRGPGTGTSDSIPSLLSNGEFVINAAQTAKFRPLLETINSGNMSFAAGGLVTPSPYVTPTVAGNVSNTSSQNITLNITGDVSRQTRSEVNKLIPMIATGVNAHNRERLI